MALALAGIAYMPGKYGHDRDSAPKAITPADMDGDGLPDEVEESGWLAQDGTEYRTDSSRADTDEDGLTDGEEAGALVKHASTEAATNAPTQNVYYGYSNPSLADTDGDGLDDVDEADLGLDPFDRDTDEDQLDDGSEVEVVGSSPDSADTDGDGFEDGDEDANRDSQGLDPLWFDVKVSKSSYATDFAKGALAGDLWREDSLAWLAGNLASGGSSFIPGVGWIVGGMADLRDVIGSAIHADWVGSGFSAAGVAPYAGDAVAIPGKAARFVARNPELAAATAAIVVGLGKVPETIKVSAAKKIWKGWDELRNFGSSEKALLTLQTGRTNLDDLSDALRRPTHVKGAPSTFFAEGKDGERYLEALYGANVKRANNQVRASTTGCTEGCNSPFRIFDVLINGVAHECKVGYVRWSPFTEKQIRKDAWLIKNGEIQGAHWHFLASSYSNTIGADRRILDLLDELRIPFTIHPPV